MNQVLRVELELLLLLLLTLRVELELELTLRLELLPETLRDTLELLPVLRELLLFELVLLGRLYVEPD